MKTITLIVVFVVSLFVIGCSSVTITNDYDKETNFEAMKTFGWITAAKNVVSADAQSAAFQNQLMEKHFKNAVNEQLTAKGLTQDTGTPALYVAYHTATQQKTNVTDYGYGYGYGRWGTGGIDVTQYTQGTIILDLIDAKSNQLVWRSVATGALASNPDPSKAPEKFKEIVGQMLKDFPPKPGK